MESQPKCSQVSERFETYNVNGFTVTIFTPFLAIAQQCTYDEVLPGENVYPDASIAWL